MKNRVSEKTKQNQGRGKGEGASYKPYIKTREVPSIGTGRILKDKITGRQMHLLSQAEVYTYYLLRWDDSVIDIREQYPLELEDTLKIADHLGYKHPHDRKTSMTTDFLVTYREEDGRKTYKAYSVKASRKILQNNHEPPKFPENPHLLAGSREAPVAFPEIPGYNRQTAHAAKTKQDRC